MINSNVDNMNHIKKILVERGLAALSLLVIFVISFGCTSTSESKRESPDSGILTFNAGQGFDEREVRVHYYFPAGKTSEMTCQFVMHGTGRNADEYLAGWKDKADEYDLIIIAPEFSKEVFTAEEYYGGGFMTPEGEITEPGLTTFSLIDRIFEHVKKELKLSHTSYNIYGHSAGGQFTHRFMLFYDSPYVDRAVAANSGWYTFPDDTIDYPYGIKGLFANNDSLRKKYYATNLTILLGIADTIRDKDLRQTVEADLQGHTRLARGEKFFDYNKAKAEEAGCQFGWQKVYVTGSGHNHILMSPAAADLLYGSQTKKGDIMEEPDEDQ
jgi:poly(3-hydroxybutyrate) depolymerase